MLNFENMRKLSELMLNEARTYTEGFVQKILDNLFFGKEYPVLDGVQYPGTFKMPDIDPKSVFDAMDFVIQYTCYGEIRIKFDESTELVSPAFRLLSECLLSNGFVRTDNLIFTHPHIG